MIDVKLYRQNDGTEPFSEWLKNLSSSSAKSRVAKAVTKMETGLMADVKSVGKGVQELRLHFEKGYRIYFGYDGHTLIVLLAGSDKKNQQRQIELAHGYWEDYKKQKEEASQTKEGVKK